MKIAIYINETFIKELSEEEVKEVCMQYVENNYPEHMTTDDDNIELVIDDYIEPLIQTKSLSLREKAIAISAKRTNLNVTAWTPINLED